MPENRLLADRPKRPTASVFVRTRGTQLPPQTVNAIRFLVANAVEGLQPNYVAVVDNLGNVLSESSEDNSLAGLSTSQLGARKQLEDHFTKKAEGMLEKVLGPGQAVVRVSTEINFDSITRTEEKYDPEGQVLRTSTLNDENTDSLVTTPSGSGSAPGIATNVGETNSLTALNSTNQTVTKKKVTTTNYEINKTTSSLTQGAGGLKRLSAAVFIAARFTGSGTNRVATPRTPEELQKLRKIVQSALGIVEGDTTRNDEITLEEIAFNDQQAIELNQRLETDGRKQFWIELATKLTYPALGLAVLGVFWRSVKKTPLDAIPLGVPIGQLGTNGHGNGHANGHNGDQNNADGLTPGVVTVDVLNQLIRENPNNMAQAVRAWMDRGNPK
jgi:flagellar M-ring protein FliF